jgi:hypothetical protein
VDGLRNAEMQGITLNGENLPSGVYLVRLETGQQRMAQTVVVIK